MEVLELKPLKNKKITAYFFSKQSSADLNEINSDELKKFLKEKNVDFATIDFDVDMKDFNNNEFAKTLIKCNIPYYQVDIPEFVMGYLYEEIVEKEELVEELIQEYQSMEDKESYKGLSLKNWIDMLNLEIQEKENFLSLRLRPQWIVKKMLDLAKKIDKQIVIFIHFVKKDICEDICSQVIECLREMEVKVIDYNKIHTIKNIIL
ncbi:MAG: hypothetical protein ACTSXH_07225 [Promethearchaeota archaeon]